MINTLDIIKREMKLRHMSPIEFSRQIGLHQSTIHDMLTRSTIKVTRLAEVCDVFKYNFFLELAQQFPYEQPVYDEVYKQKEAALNEEINRLKDENKTLKTQVDLLKEIMKK